MAGEHFSSTFPCLSCYVYYVLLFHCPWIHGMLFSQKAFFMVYFCPTLVEKHYEMSACVSRDNMVCHLQIGLSVIEMEDLPVITLVVLLHKLCSCGSSTKKNVRSCHNQMVDRKQPTPDTNRVSTGLVNLSTMAHS